MEQTAKQQRTTALAQVAVIADTECPEAKFIGALFELPNGTKLILSKEPWARTADGIKEILQQYIDRLNVVPAARIEESDINI